MTAVADSVCRCCGGEIGIVFDVASWRVPGWPTFGYGECVVCRSLTLLDDVDPAPFYADYYSHKTRANPSSSVARRALGRLAQHTVMSSAPGAAAVARLTRRPEWLAWFAGSGLSLDAAILDVGSGAGSLLRELHRWGFRDLTGCDPYMPGDIEPLTGLHVLARPLDEVERTGFGMVIFHHSLEHVDDPFALLCAAGQRLGGDGSRVVVAVPVAQGPVWEEYRDNWTALDAPVHRWLPTMDGLHRLADRAGFEVGRVVGSCTPHHLVSSELIARRIPLSVDPKSVLSAQELRRLQQRAANLRRPDRSPQLSVVFTPRRGS